MTVIVHNEPHARPLVPGLRLVLTDRLFAQTAGLIGLLALPSLAAAAIDLRLLHGVNIWLKPLKFEGALILYLLTLSWYAQWLPTGTTGKRWYRRYTNVVAAAIAAELVWIVGAAALGTASHFNRNTAVSDALYSVMGILAIVLTTPSLVFGMLIARNRDLDLAAPIRTGLVLGLVGTFVMTLIVAGTMGSMSSHLVGGNGSDAEALAIMGWARDGGDLRVPHFFATHAMHFIPAVAVVSTLLLGRRPIWPVLLFALAFAGLVTFTFLQALAGQPFLPALS